MTGPRWAALLAVLVSQAAAGCRTGAPAGAVDAASSPARSAPEVESGAVKVDAFEVPYVTEGTGRPCIAYSLLPYNPRAFSARFKSQLRCTFVETRFAISSAPVDTSAPFGVDAAVEDLEAVRKALGMSRFVLVGHSILGTVALAYALRHPEHVSHVISIASVPEVSPALFKLIEEHWEREATAERKALYAKNWSRLGGDALAKMSGTEAFVATVLADGPKRWYDPAHDEAPLLAGVTINAPVLQQLFGQPYALFKGPSSLIQPPVLLVIGRSDFGLAAAWEPYRARFRDLTFEIFEQSGHVPQVEEAALFDARVGEWLSRY